MTVQQKIKSHPDVINYFKELPFYNTYIEKPKIKQLKNIDLLSELPFYKELNIVKTDQGFKRDAMSYKVEIINKKDLLAQLETSKSSNNGLFYDLLDEKKRFKYQITVKILLKNTKALKFNLLLFITIQQQKQ